jgi:hypothetical protein
MYIGLHVKYPLMKLKFSEQVLEKYLKFEFNENPSNGSQAPHANGWTDRET